MMPHQMMIKEAKEYIKNNRTSEAFRKLNIVVKNRNKGEQMALTPSEGNYITKFQEFNKMNKEKLFANMYNNKWNPTNNQKVVIEKIITNYKEFISPNQQKRFTQIKIEKYIKNKKLIEEPTPDDIKGILLQMNGTRNINSALRKYAGQKSATGGMVHKYKTVNKYHKIMTDGQIKQFLTLQPKSELNKSTVKKLIDQLNLRKRVHTIAENRGIFNRLNKGSQKLLTVKNPTTTNQKPRTNSGLRK